MAVDAEVRARPRWVPGLIGEGAIGLEGVRRELWRLADYLSMPKVDAVQFENQVRLPDRPREGLLMFFVAGVAGANAGLYQYAGGIWKPL